ncbi:MAG TPA: type II secretion system F family protein [Gaiellaceae bacterium]|jgi:tight adherence protein B
MTPAVLLLCLFVAALAGLAVYLALPHGHGELRTRIAAFAEPVQARPAREPLRKRQRRLGEEGMHLAERMLERTAWWHRLKKEMEIAEFPLAPLPYVLGTIAATIVLAFLLALLSPIAALFALILPLTARMLVAHRLRRKRELFAEQLPDSLLVLAASLRAGHSFGNGLQAVVDEADEPSRGELKRAVADVQLGVSTEESLLRVADRMKNEDLEQVALVAALQQESGGNTAEVLDIVIAIIRQHFELRGLVQTLTAEGRMTQSILTGLPIAAGGLVALINPGYLAPLLTTSAGQVMLAFGVTLVVIGFMSIKRILAIE